MASSTAADSWAASSRSSFSGSAAATALKAFRACAADAGGSFVQSSLSTPTSDESSTRPPRRTVASPAKRAAIADAVSLKGMEGNMMVRKGEIMDWTNHMDDERWALVDETIKETLQGSALYKPLEQYAQR